MTLKKCSQNLMLGENVGNKTIYTQINLQRFSGRQELSLRAV